MNVEQVLFSKQLVVMDIRKVLGSYYKIYEKGRIKLTQKGARLNLYFIDQDTQEVLGFVELP
ncbi:unnamed protein product [Paramecium sonneborni]|uniref:Uncharacterized protein n=1 Tax=Paramecium sonneborni TaxID=65129 RepID=A0A8S1RTQ1_9CILI|nr:unnamed protein product [Paramecium sonneborni]